MPHNSDGPCNSPNCCVCCWATAERKIAMQNDRVEALEREFTIIQELVQHLRTDISTREKRKR